MQSELCLKIISKFNNLRFINLQAFATIVSFLINLTYFLRAQHHTIVKQKLFLFHENATWEM